MDTNIKAYIVGISLLLLGGCAANTGTYFSEAAGVGGINIENLSAGELRLGSARNSFGVIGAKDDLKLLYESSSLSGSSTHCIWGWQECPELNSRQDAAKAALRIIQKNPSGDDLMYFHLGWIAEELSYVEAAYEYYNISRMLFDFDLAGLEYGSVVGSTLSAGAKTMISYCGSNYNPSSKEFGWGYGHCVPNMRSKTVSAIKRIESSF